MECEQHAFCPECQEEFPIAAFDNVDDEFDEDESLCPECQMERRLVGAECTDCDRPAAHEVERGPLCEDCFEHYCDGYGRDY